MKILLILGILIFRYFTPIIYVNDEEFKNECDNHDIYYELHIDSFGNEVEYTKLSESDSIIGTYYYNFTNKSDSTWAIPIKSKISDLQEKLGETKDKEEKKRVQGEINWLVSRYFEN